MLNNHRVETIRGIESRSTCGTFAMSLVGLVKSLRHFEIRFLLNFMSLVNHRVFVAARPKEWCSVPPSVKLVDNLLRQLA